MDQNNREEVLQLLSKVVELLSPEEKQRIYAQLQGKETIPLSMFRNTCSGLEALVFYLKEVHHRSVNEIATLLNRKKTTIYTSYHNAQKKKAHISLNHHILVPLYFFSQRQYSVLEILVSYLRDVERLSVAQISQELHKSPSTIKTVYGRYKKKC